jgi:hypothetical protein
MAGFKVITEGRALDFAKVFAALRASAHRRGVLHLSAHWTLYRSRQAPPCRTPTAHRFRWIRRGIPFGTRKYIPVGLEIGSKEHLSALSEAHDCSICVPVQRVHRAVEHYWRKMVSSRSWEGVVGWKQFHQIRSQFPLLRPRLYLPYPTLQALAML